MLRDDWRGLVAGRQDDFDGLEVVAPDGSGVGTWSGPFRVLASDLRYYFVKTLETVPVTRESSLVAEFVVSRVGRLIGAPMCTTSLIRIPEDLSGWEPTPGRPIKSGIGHASLALANAEELRPDLAARSRDDNKRRHVGVYAVYDWCFGSDNQWLYDLNNDHAIYSHDHGFYLPPFQMGYWTAASLVVDVDTPNKLGDDPQDLSPSAISEMAEAVQSVERADLVSILRQVPLSWPASDQDLETLGWFLESRTRGVAERLRALGTTVGGA